MLKNIFFLFFTITSVKAGAQGANYWASSYGPGCFMTPGSVIAKNGDSGVLFYNPALLAYNTKNAATISGSIYNYQAIKIKNGAGTGLHLNSNSTSVIPVIASNTIYLKLKSPITVAYALINNPVIRFQASQRKDGEQDVLDDSYSPGKELFVGQYVLANSVHETTGLLAIGKTVSSKLAVGISFGVSIRKQTFLNDYKSRTLINDTSQLFQKLVSVTEYYLVNNLNVGLGIKAGLSYELASDHHIGLLLSLPMIHISGSGDLLTDFTINNLKLGGTTDVFLLASSKQTKLKSRWKTPLSIAAGYTYDYGKGQLYFATEYFGKLEDYNVLTPRNEYFIRPDTGNYREMTSSLLRFKGAHKAISGGKFSYKRSIHRLLLFTHRF
jgi:hypothetical protein